MRLRAIQHLRLCTVLTIRFFRRTHAVLAGEFRGHKVTTQSRDDSSWMVQTSEGGEAQKYHPYSMGSGLTRGSTPARAGSSFLDQSILALMAPA